MLFENREGPDMLKQLIDYAEESGLDAKPGFKKDYVKWIVSLDSKGNFLGVVGRHRDSKAKGDLFLCPKFSQPLLKAAGSGARHFLVDTTSVVALLGIDKLKSEPDIEKLTAKHNYFSNLIKEAAASVSALNPVSVALSNGKTVSQIRKALEAQTPKAKSTQNITFAVVNSNDKLDILVNNDVWHDWYESLLAKITLTKAANTKSKSAWMRSLASGEEIEPAKTHPKISGLSDIGGNASVALASFKPPSFRHYGLSQSENAAVSSEEASQYVASVNELVRKSRTLALGKIAFWFKCPGNVQLPYEAASVVDDDLFDGEMPAFDDDLSDEEKTQLANQEAAQETSKARKLLDSIRSGEMPTLVDAHFYALSIGANASRLVIRDYLQGPFVGLLESIVAWREDLAITKLDRKQEANTPTLSRVISAALAPKSPTQKYADWVKPVTKFREPFWRAAIGACAFGTAAKSSTSLAESTNQPPAPAGGSKVPQAAIEMLLPTLRVAVLNGEFEQAIEGSPAARGRLYCRMGLLRMFLLRNGGLNVSKYLNIEHPSPAYQCGRLLAVLANIQQEALGDVGANVVQRFYSRASTAPADAIGPIVRLSNSHLNKLDTGLAVLLRDKIANIFARINTEETAELPDNLDAVGQSLFALGYYQQIAADRQEMLTNAAKKKKREKENENTKETESNDE